MLNFCVEWVRRVCVGGGERGVRRWFDVFFVLLHLWKAYDSDRRLSWLSGDFLGQYLAATGCVVCVLGA